jgi:hypothetical protein
VNIPPAEKRSKKTGAKKMSYCKAAKGLLVLDNSRLSQLLMEFIRNKITPEVIFHPNVLTNAISKGRV